MSRKIPDPKSFTGRLSLQQPSIFVAVILGCAALGLWVVYELGQIRAGHNGFEARREYGELESRLKELSAENNDLKRQIALLETSRKIDQEAYAQVESELAGLQQEILAQGEDLEFYKGIVAEQPPGLRIQDMELLPGSDPASYQLRLVLAQSMRATQRISGSVEFDFEGERDGQPAKLGLADLPQTGVAPLHH